MREDVQKAIKKFEVNTFGNVKNIEATIEKLKDDEEVVYISPTVAGITNANTKKVEKLPGIFVLTTKRLVFRFKAAFTHSFETCELSEVKMVDCSGNGLTGGHIEIHTSIKTYDILVKYKKEVIQNVQDAFDETLANYKKANSANGTVVLQQEEDVIGKIQKLSELKESGILSEEEFLAKKAELLERV